MNYLLAILSGVLLAIPFKIPSLALLGWVGLIPLLLALTDIRKNPFFLGWIMGIVFLSVSSNWLLYPLINFSGYPLGVCIFILMLGFAFISLYFGLFSMILKFLDQKLNLPLVVLVPVVWTGIEFLRSVFSFQFLFGFLGYSQSFNPELIQLAEYGGVYIITFIMVVVNTLLYLTIKRRKWRYMLIGGLIFGLVLGYGNLQLKRKASFDKEINIGLIQPSIPQNIKMNPKYQRTITSKILRLSAQELEKSDPDLLIWPETAILRTYYKDRGFPFSLPKNTPVFVGGFFRKKGDLLNSAFLFDENKQFVDKYSKIKLVPWGEYVPFPNLIPNVLKKDMTDLTPGENLKVFNLKGISWTSPICSEILNPFFIRNLYQQTDFMINISNEAWFERSNAPLQVLQAAIFRAVEHQVPIVKVGNTGISSIIDYKGRVLVKTQIFKPTTLTFSLKLPKRRETLYYKIGNAFGQCIFLLMLVFLISSYGLKKE